MKKRTRRFEVQIVIAATVAATLVVTPATARLIGERAEHQSHIERSVYYAAPLAPTAAFGTASVGTATAGGYPTYYGGSALPGVL